MEVVYLQLYYQRIYGVLFICFGVCLYAVCVSMCVCVHVPMCIGVHVTYACGAWELPLGLT